MPTEAQLPKGPLRVFVEELFVHYRAAGRPTLREIAQWIRDHADSHDLRGTASTETIRRVLSGASVPRSWHTVATIVEALCGIAGRSPSEERWSDHHWNENEESSWTFLDEAKRRWNAVLDHYETAMPELPPPPRPPAPPTPHVPDPWDTPAPPAPRTADPWDTTAVASRGGVDDEPPF